MNNTAFKKMMAREELKHSEVINNSNRGLSAYALANLALEHGSSSANAAANLLLSMEDEEPFDFMELISFDSTNRAHADIVMLGYQPHHLWPSKWIDEAGYSGSEIISALRDKWRSPV